MLDDLHAQQLQIEEEMQGQGIARFQERVAKARERGEETTAAHGSHLLRTAIEPTAEAIESFIKSASTGKAGRRHASLRYLKLVKSDVAAFIVAKVVLDQISVRNTLQKTALAVGRKIEDEVRFTHYKKETPGLWHVVNKSIKTTSNSRKRSILVLSMNKSELNWITWPASDTLHLGIKLIELFTEATGLAQKVTRSLGTNNSQTFLEATEATMEWIEGKLEYSELLTPVYMPTVVPPKKWTAPVGGGYFSEHIKALTLIKTRNVNYLEELANHVDDMPVIYSAINSLQNTAWKVNDKVLNVIEQAWEKGQAIGKLPQRDSYDIPACPVPEGLKKADMDDETLERLKEWKKMSSNLYELNAKLMSKRVAAAKILSVAKRFKDFDKIYFPYQYDFRGRIYAVPMFLNPQGCDYAKALLTFSEGKPIEDDQAAAWLAIQGANVFGEDKVSMQARVDWVYDRAEQIIEVADDPMANLWWTEADKPWQFLAFCFDFAGFAREGYGYVSTLPIALDGSCNGLQHFSAMLRDPVGGSAVNLIPSDRPQDIYQEVADVTINKLNQELVGDDDAAADYAAKWLSFGVDRSTCKRPVMVLPYGGTLFSCRAYVVEYIKEMVEEKGKEDVFGEDDIFGASNYLAKHIWNSIGEVVVAARQAMDWLQDSARILAKEGMPICWTTPAGLPIMQAYANTEAKRVKTTFGDSIIKLTLRSDTDTLSKKRQASGIAPNFVHSMDGAALQLCVDLAAYNGITEFAMVHDSYGTNAQDTALLARCLRIAFVDMYKNNDVLEQFKSEVTEMLEDASELPELPGKGDLDIDLVEDSEFFFA